LNRKSGVVPIRGSQSPDWCAFREIGHIAELVEELGGPSPQPSLPTWRGQCGNDFVGGERIGDFAVHDRYSTRCG
jgi:hypothetical protein